MSMNFDMKEQIVEASKRLLMEKNVKKLTVTDICQECNITRQAFYYHFESIVDMLKWAIRKEGTEIYKNALAEGSFEKSLKYLILVYINIQEDLKKGLESNYGEEIRKILKDGIINIFRSAAKENNLDSHLDKDEFEFKILYHSYAIGGILQHWNDDYSKNIDEVVKYIKDIMTK